DDTASTARRLLVHGENLLQRKVRRYTPRDTGRLWSSIETQHKGRWESVASQLGSGTVSVMSFIQQRNIGYGAGRGGRTINFMLPSYLMRTYVFEGSVYLNLPWASFVEYDTGI